MQHFFSSPSHPKLPLTLKFGPPKCQVFGMSYKCYYFSSTLLVVRIAQSAKVRFKGSMSKKPQIAACVVGSSPTSGHSFFPLYFILSLYLKL